MEPKTLKFIKLLVPVIILIIEFLPLLDNLKASYKIGHDWFAYNFVITYSFLIIPALVVGVIYHLANVRFAITNISHRKIDLNITSSLLKIYNKSLTQEEHNFLKERKLKKIFYRMIFNDPSLSPKRKEGYYNSLLWTSTADLFIISIFSSIIYLILGFWILKSDSLWLTGVVLAGVAALAFCFHMLSIIRSYKLVNDQIESIETQHKSELTDKIDSWLSEWK